jgi:hypothetical protein
VLFLRAQFILNSSKIWPNCLPAGFLLTSNLMAFMKPSHNRAERLNHRADLGPRQDERDSLSSLAEFHLSNNLLLLQKYYAASKFRTSFDLWPG